MKLTFACSAFIFLALLSCKKESNTLFKLIPPEDSGVSFANTIEETDTFNILTQEYIYNGGGVGIGDFNNDGLQDIVFAGNLVANKIYLNKGELKFQDVSEIANINVAGRWNSGVTVVDINQDGWLDIYITATMKRNFEDRRNMLFVNNGLNVDGIPTFTNKAMEYKIDDDGYCTMAAFFDYDRDGDLDLYLLINERLPGVPTNYRPKVTDGSAANNDKLYRNNGDDTFTEISKEAGITIEGFGLGLAITDFNKDGWPDIYVSNDYLSNDILYVNNGDGTFKNKIKDFIGHQSQFSMGNDAADINNDAWPDIVTVDMLPETNNRKKTTIGNKSYQTYIYNEQFGYEYQYIRNMLHLNNGLNKEIKFSEIGQLSGVHQTEWSWSPLFADFDNDGNKDLIVTNGFPKDITDKDFSNYRSDVGNIAIPAFLIDSIPVVKIPNYGFKNNGDLTFTDVTKQWGLGTLSFSNGAAFADLDNDGDLDYIINNINDNAFVYENTLYSSDNKETSKINNYLRIKLKGDSHNLQAIGANVTLHYNGKIQYYEQGFYRGFLSSVEELAHFGIGETAKVDSVLVQWPDGKKQIVMNVKANQLLDVSYSPNLNESLDQNENPNQLFKKAEITIAYKHNEEDKIDFNIQRTLPHKFSQAGPSISIGDVDRDGLEDFIVGGAVGHTYTVFLQNKNGTFLKREKDDININKKEEDEGLLLFDADNDKDLDLFIVGGGMESFSLSPDYQDRLFFNDGKGNFKLQKEALSETNASGSCVRAADYDGDGDLDLFVGGRLVPGVYPNAAESYLLQNDKGKFTNVSLILCPELKNLGLVTDALWTDFNLDGKVDLIITGEFMPVMFFKNDGNKFSEVESTGIETNIGWWNSITSGDFDKDGDTDYVVGNLGLNNNYKVTKEYPLKIFAKDFDGNGSVDPILACYMRESMNSDLKKLYPVHFWDEMNSQSPKFRRKFSFYRNFGKATIEKVLNADELKDVLVLEANHMETSYIENIGKGKFSMKALPMLTQIAPVNGLVTDDINNDGNPDVIMIGNDYGNEVFAGRYDAFTGLILLGNGKGNFEVVPSAKSGFYVPGDAKALARLSSTKGDLYLATQNRDSLKVFTPLIKNNRFIFQPEQLDVSAELIYADGRKQRVEFYYGSGYLSQSTRKITIPVDVKELVIYDSKGAVRKVVPKSL